MTYPTPLLLFLALITCTACGPEQLETTDRASASEATVTGTTNSAAGLDWSQKRYERTRSMERIGQLRCDTVAYACTNDLVSGQFVFCYAGDDLVRATHARSDGDHASQSESYYYDGDEMYFAHLAAGSWRSGGTAEDPDQTGTIDEVHEEIRFYDKGDLADRRFRDYTVSEEAVAPQAGQLPDQPTGQGVTGELGSDALLRVEAAGSYACP